LAQRARPARPRPSHEALRKTTEASLWVSNPPSRRSRALEQHGSAQVPAAQLLAAQLLAAQLLAAELDASDLALSPPQYEEPAVQEVTFVRDRGHVGNLHVVQVGPAFFDDPSRV
jgi:hypothetical protein